MNAANDTAAPAGVEPELVEAYADDLETILASVEADLDSLRAIVASMRKQAAAAKKGQP
jgi:hypothetical protein